MPANAAVSPRSVAALAVVSGSSTPATWPSARSDATTTPPPGGSRSGLSDGAKIGLGIGLGLLGLAAAFGALYWALLWRERRHAAVEVRDAVVLGEIQGFVEAANKAGGVGRAGGNNTAARGPIAELPSQTPQPPSQARQSASGGAFVYSPVPTAPPSGDQQRRSSATTSATSSGQKQQQQQQQFSSYVTFVDPATGIITLVPTAVPGQQRRVSMEEYVNRTPASAPGLLNPRVLQQIGQMQYPGAAAVGARTSLQLSEAEPLQHQQQQPRQQRGSHRNRGSASSGSSQQPARTGKAPGGPVVASGGRYQSLDAALGGAGSRVVTAQAEDDDTAKPDIKPEKNGLGSPLRRDPGAL